MIERQLGGQERGILASIHEGMEVYDQAGERLGTVELVHFGSADEHGLGAETTGTRPLRSGSLVEELAAVILPDDQVPEAFSDRLMRSGFIRVDADGLFAADRYITPDQIATVQGHRVMLGVERDALIRQ